MFSHSRRSRTPPPETEASGSGFFTVICAVGVGAALMFLFDPDNGKRRRALLKDKSNSYARRAQEGEEALVRKTLHHVRGALATIRTRVTAEEPVDDGVLCERVRAALGHVVPDVNAIDVKVRDGCVVLKGPVTPDEMGEIVACAQRVRGVQQVENRLSPNSVSSPAH
jgi:osmotically-inducible protein OsmY